LQRAQSRNLKESEMENLVHWLVSPEVRMTMAAMAALISIALLFGAASIAWNMPEAKAFRARAAQRRAERDQEERERAARYRAARVTQQQQQMAANADATAARRAEIYSAAGKSPGQLPAFEGALFSKRTGLIVGGIILAAWAYTGFMGPSMLINGLLIDKQCR